MNNLTKLICIISLIGSTCLGMITYMSVGKIESNFKKIRTLFTIQTELALCHSHYNYSEHSPERHIQYALVAIQKLIELTDDNDILLESIIKDIEHGDTTQIDDKFLKFKTEFQDRVYSESHTETNIILLMLGLVIFMNFVVLRLIVRKTKGYDDNLIDKLANIDRLEMYTSMTGSIAHEFRNILSVILGYSEIILTKDDYRCKSEIITIRDLCHRAAELINQLYHSNTNLIYNDINVSDILADIILMVRKTNKDIKITCYYDRCSELCKSNKQFLEQIFLNLLTNAVYAVTVDANGEIYIEFINHSDRYEIQIHDTGIGIPDDKLTKIFELFYTTKGEMGTGLGLTVTSNLIKKLNGSINVENKDWTTFIVTIPK